MAKEIERKFLVDISKITLPEKFFLIKQGYIETTNKTIVRVRTSNDIATLTIKSARTNFSRSEYEYQIPFSDAEEMLTTLCQQPLIEKNRYMVQHANDSWEIDIFQGENKGLYLAEIELSSEEQELSIPTWVIHEVTLDSKYNNNYLTKNPFSGW
ncbi:MAG: CYTH domain-containing protein [Proteobacteria bacterium]|nr:CYTH domain-containing protein [Pseudomonadota bacterium]